MTDFDAEFKTAHLPAIYNDIGRDLSYHSKTGLVKTIKGIVDTNVVIHGEAAGFEGGSTVSEYNTIIRLQSVDVPDIARGELLVDRDGPYEVVTVVPSDTDEFETVVGVKRP